MSFLEDVRKHFKVVLSNEQIKMFDIYFNTLIEYNKHTNLTRIVKKDEVYYKHFYDSLTISNHIYNKSGSICDMGSGAGFPSIPLKIIYPELKVTIVVSSNKRINFLKELVDKLNLKNVNLIHDRAEVFSLNNKLKFDYVTARALGHLRLISEMAIPMLKVEGRFLAMKGSQNEEELNESKNALKILKSEIINIQNLELPNNYGRRSIIVIKKKKHVNKYPRRYALMLKNPL